jgi:DNA-binding XRE family transcriptional regulator
MSLFKTFNVFFLDKFDNLDFRRLFDGMRYPLPPELVRAARGLLGLSQQQLADLAGTSIKTINRLEKGSSPPSRKLNEALHSVFAASNIQFTAANTDSGELDGVGVRRRPTQPHQGMKVL